MTFGEQARRLIEEVPGVGPIEARKRINLAYRRNAERHTWAHLLVRSSIQTEPMYSVGTVSVTNQSASITLTGGVWDPAWTVSPSSRRIVIQGRAEAIDVTITSSTTATLSEVFLGATNGTATYRMIRDVYPLPSDCGLAKLMTLAEAASAKPLRNSILPEFVRRKAASGGGDIGDPDAFTVVALTGENPPRAQVELGPQVPSTVRLYRLWYFRRVPFLVNDADYFAWPEEFDDMHWLGAAIEHMESPRVRFNPLSIDRFRARYQDLYARMKREMDGSSLVEVEVRSVNVAPTLNGGLQSLFSNYRVIR